MKTVLYFFLFLISLLSATWSLFCMCDYYVEGNTNFMWLFFLTFISLASAILFGYAFSYYVKENN